MTLQHHRSATRGRSRKLKTPKIAIYKKFLRFFRRTKHFYNNHDSIVRDNPVSAIVILPVDITSISKLTFRDNLFSLLFATNQVSNGKLPQLYPLLTKCIAGRTSEPTNKTSFMTFPDITLLKTNFHSGRLGGVPNDRTFPILKFIFHF
jgi:hypothetical protein